LRYETQHPQADGTTSSILGNGDRAWLLVVCTDVHTIIEMAYQWHRDKAAANLRKHGIDFADAISVFSDDLAMTIPDERVDEERFVTIGVDGLSRVLVVVYTMRAEMRSDSSLLAKQLGKNDSSMRRANHGSRI
jgi:hypothetical protein